MCFINQRPKEMETLDLRLSFQNQHPLCADRLCCIKWVEGKEWPNQQRLYQTLPRCNFWIMWSGLIVVRLKKPKYVMCISLLLEDRHFLIPNCSSLPFIDHEGNYYQDKTYARPELMMWNVPKNPVCVCQGSKPYINRLTFVKFLFLQPQIPSITVSIIFHPLHFLSQRVYFYSGAPPTPNIPCLHSTSTFSACVILLF